MCELMNSGNFFEEIHQCTDRTKKIECLTRTEGARKKSDVYVYLYIPCNNIKKHTLHDVPHSHVHPLFQARLISPFYIFSSNIDVGKLIFAPAIRQNLGTSACVCGVSTRSSNY